MVHETHKILGDRPIQVCADLRARAGRQLSQRERSWSKPSGRSRPTRRASCSPHGAGRQSSTTEPNGNIPCRRRGGDDDDVFVGRIREDLTGPTASPSGASATTSARAPPPTPSRSPKPSSSGACCRRRRKRPERNALQSPSPLRSRGPSRLNPAASRMKKPLERRAGGRRGRGRGRGSAGAASRSFENRRLRHVGGDAHGDGVEAPRALVALEHVGASPGIEAEPHRFDDRLGQGRGVVQAEIEALPGDRVDDMGGVADQGQPLGDEARGRCRSRADSCAAASSTASAPSCRPKRRSISATRSAGRGRAGRHARLALGPHDRDDGRAGRPAQRQDGERTGGQEMLVRPGPRGRARARAWRRCPDCG